MLAEQVYGVDPAGAAAGDSIAIEFKGIVRVELQAVAATYVEEAKMISEERDRLQQ